MVPYCSVLCNSYLQFPKNNLQPTVHYAQLQMRFNRLGVFIFFAQLPKRFFQLSSSITFQSHLFEQASQIHTRKTKKENNFQDHPTSPEPACVLLQTKWRTRIPELCTGCFCNLALFSAFFLLLFFLTPARLHRYFSSPATTVAARQLHSTNFASSIYILANFAHCFSSSHTRVLWAPWNRKLMTWGPFSPAGLTHGLID